MRTKDDLKILQALPLELKVKDHSQLAIGEKIGFLSVVDVADHPTENGGEQNDR